MKRNLFKRCLFIIFFSVVVAAVISIMVKYDVEGEKNLPFSISKILLISTVDGSVVDDPNNIWNIGITQVNDIYMYIDKTLDTDVTIKEIKLENFKVVKAPVKGTIKLLRPTGDLKNLYTYSEENYIDRSLEYTGAVIDDLKSLEISNTGGVIACRFSVEELGDYISNEAQEITYDGRLLSNLGVNEEEVKFDVNFDIIIATSQDVNYKGNINLKMPVEGFIENGSASKEIKDFSNIVFKRV